MKLPDRLGQALIDEAKKHDQSHTDYLRGMLFAAAQCPSGVVLKLDLPPLQSEKDEAQPMLPLGGGKVLAE